MFKPLSSIQKRLALYWLRLIRHRYAESDEPEASRIVDCCLYLEEMLQ